MTPWGLGLRLRPVVLGEIGLEERESKDEANQSVTGILHPAFQTE